MWNEDTRDLWWLSGATALALGSGMLLGGRDAVLRALVLALALCAGAYWFKDALQLALSGAIKVNLVRSPKLYELVRDLARQAGVPMPRVYMVPKAALEAYVIGRDAKDATLVLTDGILKLLGHEELQEVLERAIAHGLAHVKQHDRGRAVFAAATSGVLAQFALTFLALDLLHLPESNPGYGFALLIAAPIVATLLHMTVMQAREAQAEHVVSAILQARKAKSAASPARAVEGTSRVAAAQAHATPRPEPTAPARTGVPQGKPAPAEAVGVVTSAR